MELDAKSRESKKKVRVEIKIREYDESTDLQQADELEKQCEAGPGGSASLFTDLLGDPLCRVRQYPAFAMLVAETQPEKELVGLVRAGVKEVACVQRNGTARVSHSSEGSPCKSEQSTTSDNEDMTIAPELAPSCFVSIAYILGLRVAPKCRRLGIGAELVAMMEEWCKARGAEYVYIATEKDNEASVGLFTKKLGYVEFRNPAILVQPVYVHRKKLSERVQVLELSKEEACRLYSTPSLFRKSEFFPRDIEAVVRSTLHKGTWVAFWKNKEDDEGGGGAWVRMLHGARGLGLAPPNCFGSKLSVRQVDRTNGRNDRRTRRFRGVRDSSGVCELQSDERNRRRDGRACMPHCVLDSRCSVAAGGHRKEDGDTDVCDSTRRNSDALQHSKLDSGVVATSVQGVHWGAHKVSSFGRSTVNIDLASASSSWAVLSLWKCNEIYQLEMKGAPLHIRGTTAASRAVGRFLSWLVPIPTMPNVFRPFGLQLIYGMHTQGPRGSKLGRHLCWLAHNSARQDGCAVVAAEVAEGDPLRGIIPHWTSDEDMWCIKRLATSDFDSSDVDASGWCKLPAPNSLFLDPRDF